MYSIGGWNTNPGSWSSGLRSRPLAGTGKFRSNGFEVSRMNSRKPIDIAPSTASAVAVRSTGRRRLNTDTAALQPVSINIHISIERSEEHTSELQSLMRISYAVFCLKKKQNNTRDNKNTQY